MCDNGRRARPSSLSTSHHRRVQRPYPQHHQQHRWVHLPHPHHHHHHYPCSAVSQECLRLDWTTSRSTGRDSSSPTTPPRTATELYSSQVASDLRLTSLRPYRAFNTPSPHPITSFFRTYSCSPSHVLSNNTLEYTISHTCYNILSYPLLSHPFLPSLPPHFQPSFPLSPSPPGHDQNRLLTLWYGFFFFAEPKVEQMIAYTTCIDSPSGSNHTVTCPHSLLHILHFSTHNLSPVFCFFLLSLTHTHTLTHTISISFYPQVERLVKRFMRDRVRYLDIIGEEGLVNHPYPYTRTHIHTHTQTQSYTHHINFLQLNVTTHVKL